MKSIRMTSMAVVFISIAAFFINMNIGILRLVGYGCIILSFFIFIVCFFRERRIAISQNILVSFFLVITLYTVGFIRNLNATSAKEWILLLMTVLIVILASNYAREIAHFQNWYMKLWLPVIISILILTMRFSWAYNLADNGFKGIYSTTTFLGIFSVLLVEICLLNYQKDHLRRWIAFVLPLIYFIYRTKVRTAYVGVIFVILSSCLLAQGKKKQENRPLWLVRSIRILTYTTIVVFIIMYPALESFGFFDSLSKLVYKYTGKILMTGRQNIWASALDLIKQKPVLGYGLANKMVNASGVHNSYLSILLQTGFAGIISLFLAVNNILKKIEKQNNLIAGEFLVYTCINLVMCLNEVMLLQGQIVLQTTIWLIMAIGLGYNNKNTYHYITK